MVTDAADWPQELYRRLGFDEIGATYEFLKIQVERQARAPRLAGGPAIRPRAGCRGA